MNAPPRRCTVVELRRYALHPGARERLIALFDREFVETQEAVGIGVLGQFRDLDDPDSFVWLRGFADMAARARALRAFYGGPVWRRHRDAANATMVDSDNVLLLRPAPPARRLEVDAERRPPPGATAIPPGIVAVTICQLGAGAADGFTGFFRDELEPALRGSGAEVIATFVSEHSPNNFPALPVREGENVFVWLTRFEDEAAFARQAARFDLVHALGERVESPPETWRLTPTARSLMPAARE